jgi:hypothetical protein
VRVGELNRERRPGAHSGDVRVNTRIPFQEHALRIIETTPVVRAIIGSRPSMSLRRLQTVRVRPGRGAVTSLLSVLALTAGGGGAPSSEEPVEDRAAAPFAQRAVTWAQGDRIHYGRRTFDIGALEIRDLRPAAYGFFVLLGEPGGDPFHGSEDRWHFFDGETVDPLGEDVDGVRVSPDGRYAGWVDRRGPLRLAGRIARVVVVDIATGEVLFEDDSGMGGGFGDDLDSRYSELEPTFLGFDDNYAYWTNAEGHGNRMRWERSTNKVSVAEKEGEEGQEGASLLGHPYDAYAGEAVGVLDGRVARDGTSGSLSPDGKFVAEIGVAARLKVYDAAGRRMPVELERRFAFLGGWLDDDQFYAMTLDAYEDGYDPAAADGTRGFLSTCSLQTGSCRDVEALVGTRSVVLPASATRL